MRGAAIPRLMAISDRRRCALPLPEWASRLAALGVPWLQVREKDLPPPDLAALAEAIRARLPAHVRLSVNGLCAPADLAPWGVHWPEAALGQGVTRPPSLPADALWGFSTHSLAALADAQRAGADYALFGPVFPPFCKDAPGVGLSALARAVASTALPVIAFGGVTPDRVAACLDAGAHGVASLSDLLDPSRAASFVSSPALKPLLCSG